MADRPDLQLDVLREGLRQMGFGKAGVTVAKAWPPHLIRWLHGQGQHLTEEERQKRPYLKVSTALGDFGILMMGTPQLDLAPSGLRIREVLPDVPEDVPDDFPLLAFRDSRDLELLRDALAAKKASGLLGGPKS